MIVVDDQISYDVVIVGIAAWYPGAVFSVRDFRPHGQILDPEIPKLLRELRRPTFVTINYDDFFNRRFLDTKYCVVCLSLKQRESKRVPGLLRTILRLPAYRTKAGRMGKVISWSDGRITQLAG